MLLRVRGCRMTKIRERLCGEKSSGCWKKIGVDDRLAYRCRFSSGGTTFSVWRVSCATIILEMVQVLRKTAFCTKCTGLNTLRTVYQILCTQVLCGRRGPLTMEWWHAVPKKSTNSCKTCRSSCRHRWLPISQPQRRLVHHTCPALAPSLDLHQAVPQ